MSKYSSFKQQQLITESWRNYYNNEPINEALDLAKLQNGLNALKKYVPNLDVSLLLKNANQIIQAIRELATLDNKQNVANLAEAKKPLLLTFLNKYGLLVGGVAMAIMQLAGTPPEIPSPELLKMITLGMKGTSATQFFSSLNGYQGAELAADIFTGMIAEEQSEYHGAHLDDGTLVCEACLQELLESDRTIIQEAKYQGKTVTLNKPMKGDVKKSKVYVRDPQTGNIKKVNFGDKNMKIKKNIPARRKSFRARHNCDNPGPKTKARYWSCKAW